MLHDLGRPLTPEEQQQVDELEENLRRQTSPEFAEERRKQAEQEAYKAYIQRAIEAGFTQTQAEFMFKEFAQKNHQHWDGRVGFVDHL